MVNPEHLEFARQGAKAILGWRLRNRGQQLELGDADLSFGYLCGANMEGANLRGADLRAADCVKANFRNAKLCEAKLDCANMEGANLKGADLSAADCVETNFCNATLTNAVLEGAELEGAILVSTILRGANLSYANLTLANMTDADMRRADLSEAKLCRAILRNANLRDATLANADLYYAELERANLEKANLRRASLVGARLTGATLVSANLLWAKFVGVVGHCASVSGANLTGVRITRPNEFPIKPGSSGGFLELASADGLEEAVFENPEELTRYIEAAFAFAHDVNPELADHPIAFRKVLSKLRLLHQLYETQGRHSPELIQVVQTITAELIKYLKVHPKALYSLEPRQFEEIIAEILASFGWQVALTPATKDGGFDLYAITKENRSGVKTSWIIECKKYARGNKVGVDVIRALWGVKQDLRVANALLATTSHFTQGADAFKASRYDLELRDYEEVVEWLNEYQPNPGGHLYIRDYRLIIPGR